jgi:hypothetical protein
VQPGNWDALAYYETPYAPEGMTPSGLKKIQRKAFLRFYLRPRILLRLVLEVQSLRHLRGLVRRARDYLLSRDRKETFLT